MIKMTFAINYDFANEKEEVAVTEISVPAENENAAVKKLIGILGGKERYEKFKDIIFLQEVCEYD